MADLGASQTAQIAYSVGFRGNGLVTIVAICGAESGWQYGSESDNGIATGPAQINYLAHTQYDHARLTNDPAYNLKAAYALSGGGRNFQPWDTYDSPPAPKDPGNGRYRQFLTTARAAVGKVDSSQTSPSGTGRGSFRNLPPDNEKAISVKIGGHQATSDLGYSLVSADVQFTNTEASQLTLTFDDNHYRIPLNFKLQAGPEGTPVEYADERWRIYSLSTQPADKGPQITMVCQPSAVMRMRGYTPPPAHGLSPTEYMAQIAAAVGLDFVGEPTVSRSSIGPKKVADPITGQKRRENAWELGQRLANNHDLVAYESRGTYYFATPKFISRHARLWYLFLGESAAAYDDLTKAQKAAGTVEVVQAIGYPSVSATNLAAGSPPQRTMSCQIRRGHGKRLRAGDRIVLSVIAGFSAGPPMAVTSVQWDPADIAGGPVSIQAADITMWASKAANGKSTSGGADTSITTGIAKRGTKSALDFTTFMINQTGDRYVYGATPSMTDPNPDQEDCSSLVEWAAYQTGIRLPRTSGQQWAACQSRSITVEKALRTRGALLFVDGGGVPGGEHVGVSLGDGKHDMAAHTSHVPLNKQVAIWPTSAGEWDRAALIPGMDYGNGSSGASGVTGSGRELKQAG